MLFRKTETAQVSENDSAQMQQYQNIIDLQHRVHRKGLHRRNPPDCCQLDFAIASVLSVAKL